MVPMAVLGDLGLPLLAVTRACAMVRGQPYNDYALDPGRLSQLVPATTDLRSLAWAAGLVGISQPIRDVALLAAEPSGLDVRPPECVWPFFVEHPEFIDQALGLKPGPEGLFDHQAEAALRLLALFPEIPQQYVATVTQIAESGSPDLKAAARALIDNT